MSENNAKAMAIPKPSTFWIFLVLVLIGAVTLAYLLPFAELPKPDARCARGEFTERLGGSVAESSRYPILCVARSMYSISGWAIDISCLGYKQGYCRGIPKLLRHAVAQTFLLKSPCNPLKNHIVKGAHRYVERD